MRKNKELKKEKEQYFENTMKGILEFVERNFAKADLHIHSDYSDSSASIKEILEYVENKTDLSIIAITDHDTIKGAEKAKEMAKKKKYRFDIIIGEEISTDEGHMIGLFLKKTIKPGMSVHDTVAEIKKQGGLAISPHPFYQSRLNDHNEVVANGIGATALIHEKDLIDGIEVINGTPTFRRTNLKARYFNRLILHKAEIGGSDAHCKEAIGKGYTIFEGLTVDDLRTSILNKGTQAVKGNWNLLELLKYAYSFMPNFLRMSFFTMLLGKQPKKHEIINFPPNFKISRELEKEEQEIDSVQKP
jgi:predicted metal-dependent phosphoesterase TrpH